MFISHKVGIGMWFHKSQLSTVYTTVYSLAILGIRTNSLIMPIIYDYTNSLGISLTLGFIVSVLGFLLCIILHILYIKYKIHSKNYY